MTIELYVFPPSPRAFKTMAVAEHLGLDCTIKVLDLTKGEQREPGYAAMNPNMRMPTLKDGDFVLWESNAICQYLAMKDPKAALFPENARLDITRWQFWELAHWDATCATFIFQNIVKPFIAKAGPPDEAVLAAAQEPFHRSAKVLDDQLRGRDYICGSSLMLADFSIGAVLIWAEEAKLPLEGYGEIKRWYAQLAALPAWRRTLEQTKGRMGKAA